ncbi:MAG: cytochrome c biogenesis protein ResB [Propionibacteriaceae bacterium]|nr:cytochrome c biogenesis protein ResB [Propionibacteriaceae bacterium]
MSPRTASSAPAMKTGEFVRWCWTQLTSMRTALVMLFMLALAAVPGSMIPQESISPIEVSDFKNANPTLDAIFTPLGMYNVYTSVWFSAIYLLLFVSLVGCILPRVALYARALRKPPPSLPARPERLPVNHSTAVHGAPEAALDRAETWLHGKKYRTRRFAEGVSAERGYSREAGNLVFHSGLVVLLLGLAWSSLLGFHGSAVIVEGQSFSNSITQYDEFTAGGWRNTDALEPFTLTVDAFHAEFETSDVQRGAARRFDADVTFSDAEGTREELIQVNTPLITDGGTQINLLGHGYAPRVTVTDGNGDVAFSGPVVFLPQDGNFSSVGVVKAPDARPERLAFEGFFFPTAVLNETGPHSVFPDAMNPELYLNAWIGPPAAETGVPQSIYSLDTRGLTPVPGDDGEVLRMRLSPETGFTLPDGIGTVTFDGWSRWVKLQMSQTPGNTLTLLALMVAVAGLCVSLFVRPRRLFVRLNDAGAVVAGLDRTDTATGLEEEVAQLSAAVAGETAEDGETVGDEPEHAAQWVATTGAGTKGDGR